MTRSALSTFVVCSVSAWTSLACTVRNPAGYDAARPDVPIPDVPYDVGPEPTPLAGLEITDAEASTEREICLGGHIVSITDLFPPAEVGRSFVLCIGADSRVARRATFACGGPATIRVASTVSGEVHVLADGCVGAAPRRVLRFDRDLALTHEVELSEWTGLSGIEAAGAWVLIGGRTNGPTALLLGAADLSVVRDLRSASAVDGHRIASVAMNERRALLSVEDAVGGAFVPGGGVGVVMMALPDGAPTVLESDFRAPPWVVSTGGWAAVYQTDSGEWRMRTESWDEPLEQGEPYDIDVTEDETFMLGADGPTTLWGDWQPPYGGHGTWLSLSNARLFAVTETGLVGVVQPEPQMVALFER